MCGKKGPVPVLTYRNPQIHKLWHDVIALLGGEAGFLLKAFWLIIDFQESKADIFYTDKLQ